MTIFPITQVPLTIPGCKLWLDAADSSTITQSGTVSVWKDKSGSGNNTSNGGGATQPSYNSTGLNGLPAIVFTLNKSLFNVTLVALQTGFTMFFVAQQSNIVGGGGAMLFNQGGTSNNLFCRFDPPAEANRFSSFIKVAGSLEPRVQVSTVLTQGTPYILSAKYNGTTLTSTMHNNGVSSSRTRTPADAGVAGFTIGNQNTSDLALSESLIYSSNLSDGDITNIARYLANKWGVSIA